MDWIRCKFQQLGSLQGSDACRQAPRVSTRTQDAIPEPQRTQVVTENPFYYFPRLFQARLVFPLRFLVSETSVYCITLSLASFRAWIDPTSKKEGHCDLLAHTVQLYVLFCLTNMYCTLYVLNTVHTKHTPYFPLFDVEVSPSTSVYSHTKVFHSVSFT